MRVRVGGVFWDHEGNQWMDLEMIMLSEVRERKILHDTTYMWKLKHTKN